MKYCYCYDAAHQTILQIPAEREVMKKVVTLEAQGLSLRDIANHLNSQGSFTRKDGQRLTARMTRVVKESS